MTGEPLLSIDDLNVTITLRKGTFSRCVELIFKSFRVKP